MLSFRLFELEPATKVIFGFELDEEVFTDDSKVERFSHHAKYFIRMLDKALNLLGPDIEMLDAIFLDIGVKHFQFGMCHCLFSNLKSIPSFASDCNIPSHICRSQTRILPSHGDCYYVHCRNSDWKRRI